MTNPIILLTDWWHTRAIRRVWRKAPVTIDAALDRFVAEVPTDILATFKALPKGEAICGFGFGSGMGLRNSWGLWFGETGVSAELRKLGLIHGDDQSGFLFTALWARLNGVALDVDAELAFYRAHWEAQGCAMDGSPLPGREHATSESFTLTKGPDGRWQRSTSDHGR